MFCFVRRSLFIPRLGCSAISLVMAWMASVSSAATLVQELFDGPSSELLNGTQPGITIGSNAWSAAGEGAATANQWKHDGSIDTVGVSTDGNDEFLNAFVNVGGTTALSSGFIYTLTATLDLTSATGGVLLGFTRGTPTGYFYNQRTAVIEIGSDDGETGDYLWINRNGTNQNPQFSLSTVGEHEVSLILDASDSVTANWVYSVIVDGVTYDNGGLGYAIVEDTANGNEGRYIGIGNRADGTQADFSHFQLDAVAVPEPSRTVLLLGALSVLFWRRRRA